MRRPEQTSADPRTRARGLVATAYVFALVAVGAMGQLAHLLLRGVPLDNLVFWIVGGIASALLASSTPGRTR